MSETSRSAIISTLDLAKRSTDASGRSRSALLYFNSRPREEVDRIRLFQTVESIISTLDLAKRSTRYLCRFSSSISFQLTTSRRGRHRFLPSLLRQPYFNSRPHEEVDKMAARSLTKFLAFQLTTSRRGRHYRRSQSHIPISISTHDLTKRSTAIFPPIKTNGAFQLTTSRRGRQRLRSNYNQTTAISTHDLTKRSTTRDTTQNYYNSISTHDLTKRST